MCSVLKRNKFRKYESHKQIKLQENDEKLPELLEGSNYSNYKCHCCKAVFSPRGNRSHNVPTALKSENHCNRTFPGIPGSCCSAFFPKTTHDANVVMHREANQRHRGAKQMLEKQGKLQEIMRS